MPHMPMMETPGHVSELPRISRLFIQFSTEKPMIPSVYCNLSIYAHLPIDPERSINNFVVLASIPGRVRKIRHSAKFEWES